MGWEAPTVPFNGSYNFQSLPSCVTSLLEVEEVMQLKSISCHGEENGLRCFQDPKISNNDNPKWDADPPSLPFSVLSHSLWELV